MPDDAVKPGAAVLAYKAIRSRILKGDLCKANA